MNRDVNRRELLEQVLRVVAALDGADAFPQDREGLEALIGRLAEGRPSEPRAIHYEGPADLPRYLDGGAGLLRKLVDEGLGALVVVHDLALAAATADRVVVVHDGRTEVAGLPADVLTPERLARVWGADARLSAEHGRTALHVAWLGPTS